MLVEHFERGGDRRRAARWCRQAAEEALGGNDFPGALARARRGVALGAAGVVRAGLRLCAAQAHFWRGEYALAEESARDAIATAPVGGAQWFLAVGELMARWGSRAGTPTSRPGPRPRSRPMPVPAPTTSSWRA